MAQGGRNPFVMAALMVSQLAAEQARAAKNMGLAQIMKDLRSCKRTFRDPRWFMHRQSARIYPINGRRQIARQLRNRAQQRYTSNFIATTRREA